MEVEEEVEEEVEVDDLPEEPEAAALVWPDPACPMLHTQPRAGTGGKPFGFEVRGWGGVQNPPK